MYITKFVSKRLVRDIIIISLCILMALFQLFFPYTYYSATYRKEKAAFEVGIFYAYTQDGIEQIPREVARIHSLGFKVIRIDLIYNYTYPDYYTERQTDVFYSATRQYNVDVALVTGNKQDIKALQYYLDRWGKYLTYVQILNEPELSSSWNPGALFTDDEAFTYFQAIYNTVKASQLPVKLYTNFEIGLILRTNVPIIMSKSLDFVGFDVYMDAFLVSSPNFIQFLHKIVNKDVVISEFGMTTEDNVTQCNYIINGLNLFKSMGLKGCWIVYWNSESTYYGIRGRLAEQKVGEWIAQNTYQ